MYEQLAAALQALCLIHLSVYFKLITIRPKNDGADI